MTSIPGVLVAYLLALLADVITALLGNCQEIMTQVPFARYLLNAP